MHSLRKWLEARLQFVRLSLSQLAIRNVEILVKASVLIKVQVHLVPEEAEKFLPPHTSNIRDVEVLMNPCSISLTLDAST